MDDYTTFAEMIYNRVYDGDPDADQGIMDEITEWLEEGEDVFTTPLNELVEEWKEYYIEEEK
jgi:hypothetical protein